MLPARGAMCKVLSVGVWSHGDEVVANDRSTGVFHEEQRSSDRTRPSLTKSTHYDLYS